MTVAVTHDEAETVIATLRELEPELRQSGIAEMSLFGSVARGEAKAGSDIDLAVIFDPRARIDLVQMIQLEDRLAAALGRPVEFMTLPIKNPYLRESVEQDLRYVF